LTVFAPCVACCSYKSVKAESDVYAETHIKMNGNTTNRSLLSVVSGSTLRCADHVAQIEYAQSATLTIVVLNNVWLPTDACVFNVDRAGRQRSSWERATRHARTATIPCSHQTASMHTAITFVNLQFSFMPTVRDRVQAITTWQQATAWHWPGRPMRWGSLESI
jgi:hypothetical protein